MMSHEFADDSKIEERARAACPGGPCTGTMDLPWKHRCPTCICEMFITVHCPIHAQEEIEAKAKAWEKVGEYMAKRSMIPLEDREDLK